MGYGGLIPQLCWFVEPPVSLVRPPFLLVKPSFLLVKPSFFRYLTTIFGTKTTIFASETTIFASEPTIFAGEPTIFAGEARQFRYFHHGSGRPGTPAAWPGVGIEAVGSCGWSSENLRRTAPAMEITCQVDDYMGLYYLRCIYIYICMYVSIYLSIYLSIYIHTAHIYIYT